MPTRLSTLAVSSLALALAYMTASVRASALSNNLPPGFAPLRVGFDPIYDAPATPMTAVACSDGARGLIPLGFPTFASLPSFPFVGAVSAVAAWNSSACATCWELRYECVGQAKEWPGKEKEKVEAEGGEGEAALDQDEDAGDDLPIATTQSTKPTSRRIFFLAIDHADAPAPDSMSGSASNHMTGIDEVVFATLEEATLSKTAMNELTCGHGVQLGVVQAAYRQVNIAMCGL